MHVCISNPGCVFVIGTPLGCLTFAQLSDACAEFDTRRQEIFEKEKTVYALIKVGSGKIYTRDLK